MRSLLELNAAAPEARILNGRWMVWEEQVLSVPLCLLAFLVQKYIF